MLKKLEKFLGQKIVGFENSRFGYKCYLSSGGFKTIPYVNIHI
jgi:hypothetical protein